MVIHSKPCKICGDMIPTPMPRVGTDAIICQICWDPLGELNILDKVNQRNKGRIERSEILYHGGKFHEGEW